MKPWYLLSIYPISNAGLFRLTADETFVAGIMAVGFLAYPVITRFGPDDF